MTLTVTHTKTVSIADDPKAAAAGEVLPSDWNADHTISGFDGLTTATSDLTFYVNTATGSDSNPGTLAEPFATIQHAVNVAANYNYQGLYFPTVNVADGTYDEGPTGGLILPFLYNTLANSVTGATLHGNITTPANCVIKADNSISPNPVQVFGYFQGGGPWQAVGGFRLRPLNNCLVGLYTNQCSTIAFDAPMEFDGDGSVRYHIYVETMSSLFVNTDFTVTANAGSFLHGLAGGQYVSNGGTPITLGAFHFALGFVSFSSGCIFSQVGGFSNYASVTGQKFTLEAVCVIDVPNFSRSTFPGDSHGVLDRSCVFVADPLYNETTASSGATVTMAPGTFFQNISIYAPLSSLTITVPPFMSNGEVIEIAPTDSITTLTLQSSDGSTFLNPPTSYTAGECSIRLLFDGNQLKWITLQPAIPTPVMPSLLGSDIGNSSGTITTLFDAPTGSLIVVYVGDDQTPNTSLTVTLSDSVTNTYTKEANSTTAPGYFAGEIWASVNTTAHLPVGGTITYSANQAVAIAAYVLPIGYTGGLDVTATKNSTNNTTHSLASGAMSQSGDAIFVGTQMGSVVASVNEGSFSSINPSGFLSNGFDIAFVTSTSTASVTYSPTYPSNSQVSLIMATFKTS